MIVYKNDSDKTTKQTDKQRPTDKKTSVCEIRYYRGYSLDRKNSFFY